ncbi:MAG: PAS domain S-box protein [Pseudomonadales bacterium]|nr:PAS domain S-box protein [Pseudomonadales bacterium]
MTKEQEIPAIDFRILFESVPALCLALDPEQFTILAVSDAYLEVTRSSRDQLLGRTMFEVFPDDPDDSEADGTRNLLASLQRVRARGVKDVMAFQLHPLINPATGKREDRYWSTINSPISDADGRLLYILHRTEDVTEYIQTQGELAQNKEIAGRHRSRLRQLEDEVVGHTRKLQMLNEQLRNSQERMQAMFRDTSVGIILLMPDGRIDDANVAYCNMLGYELEELRTMAFIELTHPEDREDSARKVAELRQGLIKGFSLEKRYLKKSGELIWTRITSSAMRDNTGGIVGLIGVAEDISAQKLAEISLQQNEALSRIGGQIAGVGGWAVSHDKTHDVYWSPEIFKIVEYAGDRPPTLSKLSRLIQSDYLEDLNAKLENCARRGEAFVVEIAMNTFKGKPIWARLAAEADYDQDGRIVRTLGAFQDITQQKNEELEREALGSRLTQTLESMTDAFYLLDEHWRYVYVNREAERSMAVERGELLGKVIWERFPHMKNLVLYEGYHRAVRDRQPFHADFFSPFLDNWFEVHAYPSPGGLAVYFRAVTEQRRLAAEIAESEKRLRYIAEATLDVAWDWDMVNDTIWRNDGMARLFGFDQASHESRVDFWTDNIHPEDREAASISLQRAISNGDNQWRAQYRFRCTDGTYVSVEDRGVIIRDAEGRALRMVGGLKDITQRLELEGQLRQSQRLEAVGQLTGGVAHDFNNLLTVIMGNAELLHEQLEDKINLQSLAKMIGVAAQRGADLTQHLLAFARRQALEPKIVDIRQLVQDMHSLFLRTLGEDIDIKLHLATDAWPVLIDPAQLESALLNLCLNARDAMPEGGLLTIETLNLELDEDYSDQYADISSGSYLVLAVSDTGSGIPSEYLGRVFEPFFTTKEKGKGTGLGLSTVFGFIKQSRGHMNIYSEPGQGTTVRIYLPRVADMGEELHQVEAVSTEIQGGHENVLLVEDDALVRQYACEQLQALGYRVILAENGRAALAIIQTRDDIDLLFTDVVMPGGLSGRELAEQAVQLRPGLKVLYTSGYTENSIVHNGRLDRGVQLLGKPYLRTTLAAKVRETLDGNTGNTEEGL